MVKIMVVDDMENTLELVDAVLSLEGFEVETYSVAEKAMASLKKGHKPDLLLLDMRMPKISGPEFCRQIRKEEKLKDLKVIFFTASSDIEPNLLKETGAIGFIYKPFDNDKFVKEINIYLN